MALLIVRGELDNLNFYNISTGLKSLNPDSEYKIEELYEVVQDLLESGELDSLVLPTEIKLASLDNVEIEIDGEIIEERDFNLVNREFLELIDLSEDEEGDIYLFRHYKGEGEFSYEIDDDFDLKKISFDYIDCSLNFDQFDVLRESYLQTFCDSIIIDSLKYDGEELEFEDFIFEPQLVRDELYIVKEDKESGVKILEKLIFFKSKSSSIS
ncbi:MAG: hypothetical protein GXN91_01785 [Epsilonproteobacteria bacterium]|nr:hypothetical protein [Campylobacterota bacterium]